MTVTANAVKACILGHAVGDALGVPVEFSSREELDRNPVTDMRGFGTYAVPAGSWSDDTSMTLCALDSLAKGRLDPDDVMNHFGRWYYRGEFTPGGEMFDVGNTCSLAIDNYFSRHIGVGRCGLTGERANGNGSLMRILPFALYASAVNGQDALGELWGCASLGSSLTHAHLRSRLACEIYATVLYCLLRKPSKDAVEEGIYLHRKWNWPAGGEYAHFDRVDSRVLRGLSRHDIRSSGYVVDTLEAALWCLLTTDSYRDCVLTAVNLGGDTDTVAAVAGGLAGVLYGLSGIPQEWLCRLQRRDYIEKLCEEAAGGWRLEKARSRFPSNVFMYRLRKKAQK